ncbi:reductase-like protein [Mycena capillaripes]|nr:reductase-like protein [Mycena capillaripes]
MASFIPSKIVIFGGTGIIGQFITSSILRARPAFEVLLFTSPNTASTKTELLSKWKAEGLSVVTGDVTKAEDVLAAYQGVDTVISCVGRGVLQHQIELIRLAEETPSVKWFFPSEYGTDIEHNAKSPDEKPHQIKLKVRAFVRDQVKRLKVTYVVTGPYFDMWVNTIPGAETAGGFVNDKKEAYVIDEGEGKVGFCTMSDVGKCVVASLKHPEAAFNKALKVQSFVVTPNEVLAEYEKQTGEKWKVTKTPLEAIKELEAKLWDEGYPKATGVTLRRIWGEGGTLYAKNDNEVIGLKEEDMEPLSLGVKRALEGRVDAL